MNSCRGRPRASTRLWVENCVVLSVSELRRPRPKITPELQKWGFYTPNVDVTTTWADGSVTRDSVKLAATILPSGGERLWLLCPSCGQRRAKLYATDEDRRHRCRKCLGLMYESQYRKGPKYALFRMIRKWTEDHQRCAQTS
jgi:hypothetical protein